MKNKSYLIFLFLLTFVPFNITARTHITDWYIKDFYTEIRVNEDRSLHIVEKITADCGEQRRHGIYRIVPNRMTTAEGKKVKTPIELLSITDFDNKKYNYEATNNVLNRTITWKIGDRNIYVSGENYYRIEYIAYNAIHDDVLDWNILGSFWDLEIDNFKAKVIFPDNLIIKENDVSYAAGLFGLNETGIMSFYLEDENTIIFNSERTIKKREGATVTISLPSGYFNYDLTTSTFVKVYGDYFFFLVPLILFVFSLMMWKKHGEDYKHKGFVREFTGVKGTSPLLSGVVFANGRVDNNFMSAAIISMAINGYLKIVEKERKVLFTNVKEIYLEKLKEGDMDCSIEKMIFDTIFKKEESVSLSSLRQIMTTEIRKIKKAIEEKIISDDYFYKKGIKMQKIKAIIAVFIFIFGFPFFALNINLGISIILSSIILFTFSFLMPKRTKKGLEVYLHMRGLKEYMSIAEKERQQFYEEEGIFERLLPYAIIFGIVKEWAKKMEQIYGGDYFKNYTPMWYAGSMNSFDVNSLSRTISSVSSQIGSSTSSSSSGAGGGGGGGGGGGW